QFPGAAPIPIAARTGFSIFHYIGDGAVWRDWFHPGLLAAMSGAWWAILALAGVGLVIALVAPKVSKIVKVIGVASIVSLVAYAVNDSSAGGARGAPVYFAINLRYAFPALVLGLVLVPLTPALAPRTRASVVLTVY